MDIQEGRQLASGICTIVADVMLVVVFDPCPFSWYVHQRSLVHNNFLVYT